MKNPPDKDDRILPLTRVVMLIVVPFLLSAFTTLYIFPERSGEWFAWEIKPEMTSLLIGAGYLGGAYQLFFAAIEKRWHRVAGAFLPVTLFTVAMLTATLLHWDRFDIRHFPFQLWLILYILTPVLIPYLWLRNRITDPGIPEVRDLQMPVFARAVMFLLGLVALGGMALLFLLPQAMMGIWLWKLTPLTARVLGGWFGILGMGGLVIALDSRWSSWRIPIQSIVLWGTLAFVGALRNPQDFAPNGVWNAFTVGTLVSLTSLVAFMVSMELVRARRARKAVGKAPAG